MLLQKADGMFPEGQGGPRPFAKDGAAAEMTNDAPPATPAPTAELIVLSLRCC